MLKETEPKIEKTEKKDYITRYKNLEIKEVGKGGNSVAKELENKYLIDVEDIAVSVKPEEGKVEEISFKERFLPADYRFAFSKEGGITAFECEHKTKTIIYSELGEIGKQLNLLHEIGHARNNVNYNGLDARVAAQEGYLSALENRTRGERIPLSKEELKKAKILLEQLSLIETRAWKWAEKAFEDLKKEGTNLEPEVKTPKELREIINYSLKSGDRTYMSLIKLIFGKPIFWKGKEKKWIEEFERGFPPEL